MPFIFSDAETVRSTQTSLSPSWMLPAGLYSLPAGLHETGGDVEINTVLRPIGDKKEQAYAGTHTYVHTRVLTSQSSERATKEIGKRRGIKTAAERAGAVLLTKRHLIALAAAVDEGELADRVKRCHSKLTLLSCGRHVVRAIPNYVCEFRLCPNCARRRSKKHTRNYLPKVRAFAAAERVTPVHVVLTQAHRNETLSESLKRITSAFRKLIRRSFWKRHFKGGLWTVEVTIDNQGRYHSHLHLLAFRTRFFDVSELKTQWFEATGDSTVLRLDRIQGDLRGGLAEVLKYVAKPLAIECFKPRHLREFLEVKGMRFFGTFGEFSKFSRNYTPEPEVNPPLGADFDNAAQGLCEGDACPFCNDPLFEVRLMDNELPDFLRRIEATARAGSTGAAT